MLCCFCTILFKQCLSTSRYKNLVGSHFCLKMANARVSILKCEKMCPVSLYFVPKKQHFFSHLFSEIILQCVSEKSFVDIVFHYVPDISPYSIFTLLLFLLLFPLFLTLTEAGHDA